jgi:mono/diheme cytochrome c family protein
MSKKLEPGMAYDMKKLNKVFAFLSILFLAVTFWVFLDDFVRPWKAVQIQGLKVKQAKIDKDLAVESKKIDDKKIAELDAKIIEGEKLHASRSKEIENLNNALEDLELKMKAETIKNGQLNSNVSATNFNWEIAHSHHSKKEANLFKLLKKYKKEFAESKDRMKGLTTEIKLVKVKLLATKTELTKALKDKADLVGAKELLVQSRKSTQIGPIFAIRNAPMADFLDPTLKIRQVVLNDITDDRYFQHVPKVDRCMTCHLNIDKPGYEDVDQPYTTHSKLDLMVGAKSPHPMKQTGCTSCHGGEGHRVLDFNAPAHTPRNAEQKKEWVEKYNYHPPHKVPQVQYKVGHVEASCIKCHKGVERIPGGSVVNEGIRNIEQFGCYGCHKIEGWEHKRKPGPSLQKIASKVSKEFFKNWVWSPKAFNKHANMPAFFDQTNNSKPEHMKKNITEVNAMADFIFSKSDAYKPFATYSEGNKARGKKLINEVGCMGCHGVEGLDLDSKKINAAAGPYLTGTGTKIKSANWLVSWLKRPSHYQEDTIMPSMRLTDREANDIAAYLLSLKNKKFEDLKFEPLDEKTRDDLLIEYFSAFDTLEVAKAKLAKMDDVAKTHELGKRSVGKYGCYSCHNIDGFEGRAPIGPELSAVGSKPLTQFGFGHEYDVEHSRDGWIKAHLQAPRRWDNGIDKPFKDLLRMPNFKMTDAQAESITVALVGMVNEYIPMKGVKNLDHHEKVYADGMKVANKFNCVGCHKVKNGKWDQFGGDILNKEEYSDDLNMGPPWLVDQGHRVQSDWLHNFLKNVTPIRPWIQIRMPSYNLSNEEINTLVMGFQAGAKQQTFVDNHAKVEWAPGEKNEAKKLFNALACASCHTDGFNKDEAQAPNLYLAKRRLRPSWIKKWIMNPQSILPHTSMSNFFEDGEAMEPDYFGGDVTKQVEALTKYVLDIGEMDLPKAK